jgi:hypothetical protein
VLLHRVERLRTFAEQAVALQLGLPERPLCDQVTRQSFGLQPPEKNNVFARLAIACSKLTAASSIVIPGKPGRFYHVHGQGLDPLDYLDPTDLPFDMVRRAELITAEHRLVQPSAPLASVGRAFTRKDLGSVLALPVGNGGMVLLFAEESRDFDIHDWQMLAGLCVLANSSSRCTVPASARTRLGIHRSELELRAAFDYGHRATLAGCPVAFGNLNLGRHATGFWSRLSCATTNPFVHEILSLHCSETGGAGCAHWLASGQVLLLLIGASAASCNARLASLSRTGPESMEVIGFLEDYEPSCSEAESA